MNSKLNCIMLVDDDRATNYLHNLIIKKANCAENIVVKQSADEALAYLREDPSRHPAPSLILLDINMPRTDGWEFMEEYKKLPEELKAKTTVVMLSTSDSPGDRKKAMGIKEVSELAPKPLTEDLLLSLINKYFARPV